MKKCPFFQIFSFDPLIKILISIVGTSNLVQNAPLTLSYPHRNFQVVIVFFFNSKKKLKKQIKKTQKQKLKKKTKKKLKKLKIPPLKKIKKRKKKHF